MKFYKINCNNERQYNMLFDKNITIKQAASLLLNCGFKKCELWTEKAHVQRYHNSKAFRSHMIASKKMDLLTESGLDYKTAQMLVIMEGNQRVNRKNLLLLGKPVWSGTLEELSNRQELLNELVCDCSIEGLFRKTIQIIVKDDDIDINNQ